MATDTFYKSAEFQAFFQGSQQSMVLKADAPRFTILAVSDAYLELVHRDREDLLGKALFDAFPGNSNDESESGGVADSLLKVIVSKVKTVQPLFKYEIRLGQSAQTETHYWTSFHQPQLDEAGDVAYIFNTTANITEQVLQRQNMFVNQQYLDLVVQSAEMGTWLVNLSSGLMTLSEKSREILRIGRTGQFSLQDALDRIDPVDLPVVEEKLNEARTLKKAFQVEYRYHPSNGSRPVWIRSTGTAREEGDDTVILGAMMDITDQKTNEQRKDDFIGMVSHELKTPLTSISGYIQFIQMNKLQAPDAQMRILEKVTMHIRKMTTLINGFLNVSRFNSSHIQVDKSVFDMAKLLKDAEEEAQTSLTTHHVIFAPVDHTMVYADRDKVGQVITNLLSNAQKYSSPGTEIRVACVTQNKRALFSVKDYGIGISTHDLPKLFERYYRVKGDENKAVPGFGIGLYLCCEIVKRHGGDIWAESRLGEGSTFYFTLPVMG